MEFPNRIAKHLRGSHAPKADAPKPHASWDGTHVHSKGAVPFATLLNNYGVPIEPPFNPNDCPGPAGLVGPFAQSVVAPMIAEAIKASVLAKVATYDVPGYPGVVYVWLAMGGNEWANRDGIEQFCGALFDEHTRRCLHVSHGECTDCCAGIPVAEVVTLAAFHKAHDGAL